MLFLFNDQPQIDLFSIDAQMYNIFFNAATAAYNYYSLENSSSPFCTVVELLKLRYPSTVALIKL